MKRLIEIRYTLIDMAEAESKKLYRLAWRAEEHGCSNRLVDEIRSEARWLHGTATAYPERLKTKLRAEMAEHSKTKEALKEQRISTDAEHKFLLIERGKRSEQGEKIRSLEAELHDRDMTIMELKAKLYDLMVKKEGE